VRGNNDDGVLLLIEQDRFDTSWDFTDLRAVLEVISEANCTRSSTEEK